MTKNIYLDHAATTPVDRDVMSAAMPFYSDVFYNASSLHACGQRAAAAVEHAREQCAAAINARANEVYFTSGGTESINWAMSVADRTNKKRVIVSAIEHDAAIACAEALASRGLEVIYVKPTCGGTIAPDALEKVIDDNTALVCVMTVNNITGAIQPIKELCGIAHRYGALFFTDAVQAVNSMELDVKDSGVDMLAVSGHKFYAPKGVGFLYVKNDVRTDLDPLMRGGEQEKGKRAGTVDVPSVVAMGKAIEKAHAYISEYNAHAILVGEKFLNSLKYGDLILCDNKTSDIMSVVFDGINGGRLAVALSCAGLCCSVGSACSAGSATPPRTLLEMGVKNADCAIRFSFGKHTSLNQASIAARTVNAVVKKLCGK